MAQFCVRQTSGVVQKLFKNMLISHTVALDDTFLHYDEHVPAAVLASVPVNA